MFKNLSFMMQILLFCVYLLIRKLGRLALLLRFSAKIPALFRAIVIIPNLPGMFNENRTFLRKISSFSPLKKEIVPEFLILTVVVVCGVEKSVTNPSFDLSFKSYIYFNFLGYT
jgi:hypothetical protein